MTTQNFTQPAQKRTCAKCGKSFLFQWLKQGGGRLRKYCSPKCRSLSWVHNHKKANHKYISKLENKTKKAIGSKKYRQLHPLSTEYKMWSAAKFRAREKHLDFTIQIEDVKIPAICPLLNIPIIVGRNKHDGNSPSIDRINAKQGYTPENTWVISHRANTAKSSLSLAELKTLTENLEHAIIERKIYETRR